MSKKSLVLLIIIAVLVIGGYFLFRNKGAENLGTGAEQTTDKKIAFSDFLKQGGAYKCEFNQKMDNAETKAITYMDNGMFRGEYSSNTEGMNITSTSIIRDGYSYSWTSAMPNIGYKIKIDTAETDTASETDFSGSYGFNANDVGDYNCEAWNPEQSIFAIPTNITFTEIQTK